MWRNSFQISRLKSRMAAADSYDEWLALAHELDRLEGNDKWREADESPSYHLEPLKRQIEELEKFCRNPSCVRPLIDFIHLSLHRSMGDITDPDLYQRAHAGTKHIVGGYLDVVEEALGFLADMDTPEYSLNERIALFEDISRNFGRSALILSGGATLGMFHMGVVKALFEQSLLPTVISGSSAGSIIAGVLCVRNDQELQALFSEPASINTDAFRLTPFINMLKTMSLMDPEHLYQCIRENIGDATFREAYKKTGRVLNITISPTRKRQTPRVLNYITAPNVSVSRSALVSCAVPGLFPPGTLTARDIFGTETPYIPEEKWADGSLYMDLPVSRLSRLHNVNHFIVSQTNPLALPFIVRREKGVASFALKMTGTAVKSSVREILEAARERFSTAAANQLLNLAHALIRQSYTGHINIYPDFPVSLYRKVFSNPGPEDLKLFIRTGERAAWPHIVRIRDHTRIHVTMEKCLERLRKKKEAECIISCET